MRKPFLFIVITVFSLSLLFTKSVSGLHTSSSKKPIYLKNRIQNQFFKPVEFKKPAQPPTVSYNSPQVYYVGIQINPLAPTSSGVSAPGYGNPVILGTGFNFSQGLALDAVGNLFIADNGSNEVKEIPAGGGAPIILEPGYNFTNPNAVTVDASDNVYIAEFFAGLIVKIPAGGGSVGTVAGGFGYPGGLAIDSQGNIYVGDTNNNIITEIPENGSSNINLGSNINGPQGMAIDNAGNIYVADQGDNTVREILKINGNTITLGQGFNNPQDVAVDPSGNIYVADYGNNQIKMILAGGSQTIAVVPGFITSCALIFNSAGDMFVADNGDNTVKEFVPVGGYYISPALPAGLTFNSITGAISGTPTATSPTTNYTVTAFNGDGGSKTVVTITVNAAPPTIITNTATGAISACAGTASASPNVQQFTVSGNNLSANIIATAPPGFEISLAAGSGYGNSVTLAQSGGSVTSTVVYVRSAAADAPGSISGNVVLASAGATSQNVAVAGYVNALPTINPVPNQTFSSGSNTKPVYFTGTGNTFTWVNNTPGIGLPVSGTGNINSFIASNTGTTPITATITVNSTHDGFAYILNGAQNNISIINTSTNTVIAALTIGISPIGVAVNPNGNYAYIANGGSNNVTVLNTLTNSITTSIPVGNSPTGVAVSADGSAVYVANGVSGTVSVINTATNTVTGTIKLGGSPNSVTVSPDGGHLYVSNFSSNNIWVINTITSAVTANVTVGQGPYGIAISPDGNFVYVANNFSNTVSVINATNNMVISTVPVGTAPVGISVSPDGNYIYATNSNSNNVSVINAATYSVATTVPVGHTPYGISVSPDNSMVYVANSASDNVSVISTTTNTVISTIPVGEEPTSKGNFITAGNSCPGIPVSFTITIDPLVPPNILVSMATGTISACAGTASASPDIEQFTVSGSNLLSNITAAAPPGFEVSLSPGSGYGSTVVLTPSGNSVGNTVVYVRSAASDAPSPISGNVVLTSGAISQNIAVTGIVHALPVINAVSNQTVITGAATAAINFTGTADTVTWVNNAPGIGLAAGGTGNIPSFTAINSGDSPVIATITATPVSLAGYDGCSGTPVTFTIKVYPTGTSLTIPNTFTPNGDGINDTWNIKNIEDYPNCTVNVYNRWGEKVFSSIGYGKPWDGRYNGANLPVGTYYYIIDLKNNSKALASFVTIIR